MELKEILGKYIIEVEPIEHINIQYYYITGSECFVHYCYGENEKYCDDKIINIWQIFEFSLKCK
jgi:hypothetical protein